MRADLDLSEAVPEPGVARYRHPRGWTMLLGVPDVDRPLPTQVVDGVSWTLVDA